MTDREGTYENEYELESVSMQRLTLILYGLAVRGDMVVITSI